MLKKIFIYFLISAVVISANGIVLAFHTCFTSSTKSVSLFEDHSCNGKHSDNCDDESSCEVKGKCCLLQYSYYKLELPSSAKKFSIVDYFVPALISYDFIVPQPVVYLSAPAPAPRHKIDIPILFSQLLI